MDHAIKEAILDGLPFQMIKKKLVKTYPNAECKIVKSSRKFVKNSRKFITFSREIVKFPKLGKTPKLAANLLKN